MKLENRRPAKGRKLPYSISLLAVAGLGGFCYNMRRFKEKMNV